MAKVNQRIKGGIIGFIGFVLSPASFWNDLYVNFPIALALAYLFKYISKNWFIGMFIFFIGLPILSEL